MKPSVNGDVVGANTHENTLILHCNGKKTLFKVARDAKVTFNGQKGYSFDDLANGTGVGETRVMLTIKDGIAVALDVTLTLSRGEKLWRPGMSPLQVQMREATEIQRFHADRWRR